MKLRFLMECRDKYTGEIYKRKGVYEFDEKRANELLKTRYVEKVVGVDALKEVSCKAVEEAKKAIKEVKEAPKEAVEEAEEESDYIAIDLNALSYQKLRKMAKEMGLITTGSKEELIDRIQGATENA